MSGDFTRLPADPVGAGARQLRGVIAPGARHRSSTRLSGNRIFGVTGVTQGTNSRDGARASRRRLSRWRFSRAFTVAGRVGAALAVCLCLGSPAPARARDPGELAELQERIAEGRVTLDKAQRREASVQEVLDGLEVALERRTRRLETLNARLKQREQEFKAAEREASEAAAALRQGRRALAPRARALYRWQRSGTPFVLLNGELSMLELMRRKHSLETVLSRDQALIGRLADNLRRSRDTQGTVEARRRALARERDQVAALRDELRSEQAHRQQTLRTLRRERQLRERALQDLQQALKQADRRLEGIIRGSEESRRAPVASPAGAVGDGLVLPVDGRIVSGFGVHKHPDLDVDVHRPGIDIAAPGGAGVRAVEPGRVLFADRLPGYGKMLILDHGKRHYTVYGHLSELAKSVGDRVERGERIARLGDDPSSGQSRLYFEMRRNGKPVDPLPWFPRARAGRR